MNRKLGRLLQPSFGMYFVLMAGFVLAAALMHYYVLAAVEAVLTMALYVVYVVMREKRHKEIQAYLNSTMHSQDSIGGAEPPFPMAALRLGDGGLVFANESFAQITGLKDSLIEKKISEILPNFTTDWLASGKNEYPYDVTLGGRRYRAYGTALRAGDRKRTVLGMVYFADLTELYQVRDEYIRSRPVVSIILVDNYDELTKNLSEAAISTLNARISETVTQWAEEYHGLLRQLEKNRFLFVFEKRDLAMAVENKFSLLEQIHEITSPSGLAASISFGLGVDGATFAEGYDFAALSVDMALSRGGDQAVIKDRLKFEFFGGRTAEADHRSKVRARVTANSLCKLISGSSQVFIMGHRNADLDAVGAAVGVYCMCRKLEKKAYIVMDMEVNSAKKLVDEIKKVPEYHNAFISGQDALLLCDNLSTLVVVDTNRPDQVEYKNLLESMNKVCVIDHHRRAADYIESVVVNHHEPYASSAAELVTELLQYAVDKSDVLPIEAKSLLAGIFLDTKSFHVRTGERTFETAAYLRQLGADPVEVKKLLQNDFQDTIAKYQIIKSARLYRQEIAIAALNSGTTRVLAAQAADELLNIQGISTSFVLYPDGEQVIISARSIGKANVQMILEPLGGGGNAATAGAQIKNASVKDVLDRLIVSIENYFET